MIARRDVLRLAAALGAGGAVASRVAPAEAAALLSGPAADPLAPLGPDAIHDPAAFAEHADVGGDDSMWELSRYVCPAEYAEYLAARAAFVQAMPLLEDLPARHPYHQMDEATHAIMTVAYCDGLRHGAAYEHLRRVLLGPLRTCARCHGIGLLNAQGRPWHKGAALPCGDCAGGGLVPGGEGA